MQDEALLEELQHSPDAGMTLLMKQYGGLVYAIVKGKLSGSAFCAADIEHCVADTFSEFYCDLGKYNPASGSIKSWLCVIAKHNALDYLRRHDKVADIISLDDEAMSAYSADAFSVEEDFLKQDFRRELIEEIRRLGEPDCELILRKYYLSQSSKEIADKLNMTVSAVDTRTHRAIKKLREKFGGAAYEKNTTGNF